MASRLLFSLDTAINEIGYFGNITEMKIFYRFNCPLLGQWYLTDLSWSQLKEKICDVLCAIVLKEILTTEVYNLASWFLRKPLDGMPYFDVSAMSHFCDRVLTPVLNGNQKSDNKLRPWDWSEFQVPTQPPTTSYVGLSKFNCWALISPSVTWW